jgi:aspartyl-tRNA(Asn)/glutamyl-tRNA(Gln) amidotransferase subunit A
MRPALNIASPDPFLPAWELAGQVQRGELGAETIVRACLERIGDLNPLLGAYTDVLASRALATAKALDAARGRGAKLGPLAGVPFAVKNLFDVTGLPTRAGSKINRARSPAQKDAVLVQRMERAGAVLVGGLNMGEYAYDFTGENSHDGACCNPHDRTRMAGGSSSGCGAATAAGLAPISLGSDTNGSIRVPSSLCGIFGLKPTYGRLPRTGTFPFCDSLDHLGPFARCVRDLAMAYDALQGYDVADHACANRPTEAVAGQLERGIDGLRIAIAGGHFDTDGMPEATAAVETIAAALGTGEKIMVERVAEARAAAFLITNAESATFHLDRLRRCADDFDPDTRDRFLAGAMLPATWYVRAQAVRRAFHDRMLTLFKDFDLLIAPATPCSAPQLGEKTLHLRGSEVALRPNLGLFTQPVSAIGLPVCCVPVFPAPGGLPIGVQIIAPPWREDLCLRAAAYLEQAGASCALPPAGL